MIWWTPAATHTVFLVDLNIVTLVHVVAFTEQRNVKHMADLSSQPGRKNERSGQKLSLLWGRGKKKKISKHSGLNHTRKAVQHVADIWRYVFMLKWEESTFMLTNAKCVRPKGRKDASWQRAPECMECEFMRAFCVRGRARASLCLPVCLCVREREGEQNGLRGTLCFNWWHVARWKSTLQIPVLTGACSCPEDTQSTQAPRTSCVQTFLTL